jgi:hypothetical protein
MKGRFVVFGLVALAALLVLAVRLTQAQGPPAQSSLSTAASTPLGTGASTPLSTGFTYQGKLEDGSGPVTADCEMAFRLYDEATAGNQVGSAITVTVAIADGLFSVSLDFSSGVFASDARWLGIVVKCPGDSAYADLGRQELTAAPYAFYALNADLLDGQHGSYYQVGRPVFSLTTLDSAGGQNTSIIIGADGLGLISYRDYTSGGLKVAHCSNAACTAVLSTTLDSAGAANTSITVGADGLGLVSYRQYLGPASSYLKVAHCLDASCTAATITTLDSAGIVGFYTSSAIGADGLGLISYYNNTPGIYDLEVAHCSNTNCTAATTTLDSAGIVGEYTSITIGADGLGLISYRDATNGDLKVAHCSNTACTAATITTLDSAGDVGQNTSITIGADGLGLISYRDATNGDLKVAHCSDPFCVPYSRRR